MIVYIHGFNSSPASNTYGKLKALFDDAQALEKGMAEKAEEFRAQGSQLYRRD